MNFTRKCTPRNLIVIIMIRERTKSKYIIQTTIYFTKKNEKKVKRMARKCNMSMVGYINKLIEDVE